MRSREELAYAAGLFEGEGCITSGPHAPVSVEINMTDHEPLQKFVDALGLGYVRQPTVRHPPHLPMYRVGLYNFRDAQAAIALMWTWLGPRRRARAKAILTSYQASRSWERQRNYKWRAETGYISPHRKPFKMEVPA